MLSESPAFNAARRYGWPLQVIGVAFVVVGFFCLLFSASKVTEPGASGIVVPRALGYAGAALWTAAAGFLSCALMCFGRVGHLRALTPAPQQAAEAVETGEPPASQEAQAGKWHSLKVRLESIVASRLHDPELMAQWPPSLLGMLFGLFALGAVFVLWRAPVEPELRPLTLKFFAAGLLVAAFPLLVLERFYAGLSVKLLPEAPQLERLLRLPLTASLALALELLLRSAGVAWSARIEPIIGLLIGAVALEVLVRCATIVFIPFAPIESRRSLADSGIAGVLLRLAVPRISAINLSVRRQFGIDLSRSWALGFLQKAALPVLVGTGVLGWAATGVTALNTEQRGIYERLGEPVEVFGPGLHLHLPWPLGKVRPVELGVVHLLPIEFLLPGGAEAEKSSSVGGDENEPLAAAEGPAPTSADRLWTDDHPYEGNYIIASAEGNRQSFQLVDIDMAVMYRIGASPLAARNAAYHIGDIDEMIQALSGQLLVRYFTHNTLLDLLGKSRESFTQQFQTALQEQLDRFATGVEAIGVSVEAIHPPPGAANAYHEVQAAEIAATTQISLRRGDAARALKSAEQQAGEDHNEALATAAERVAGAQSRVALFNGDRQAYAQDGYPFVLERWFDDLTRALTGSPVLLIDHRLARDEIPSLDLRNLTDATAVSGATNLSRGTPAPSSAPESPLNSAESAGEPDEP